MVLGFSNTNALIMTITYGLCFGVELTMNNKLVPYFTGYYGLHPTLAGPLGACFSLMNLCCRAWGGMLSDIASKSAGLRGRITAMWVVQTIEGLFCILMGLVTLPYDGPDEDVYPASYGSPAANVQGIYKWGTQDFKINGTLGSLSPCSSAMIRSPEDAWVADRNGVDQWTPMPVSPDSLIMIKDPGSTCVHNQDTLLTTMICMICFSICVQMAEGLHFGIVPYISRPALGVVSHGRRRRQRWRAHRRPVHHRQLQHDGRGLHPPRRRHHDRLDDHALHRRGRHPPAEGLGFNPSHREFTGQKGADQLDFSNVKTKA